MKNAIPYYRVSTERQGKSGLGLEAQRQAVHEFALQNKYILLDEFTEVESGTKPKRPVLMKAIEACKKNHAVLIIAKLDRLGRNVAFVSKLMETNIEFVAVDNPHANKLIVHIMAAFAEFERDQISNNTKNSLKAAKEKGIKLGVFGKNVLSKRNKIKSNGFAALMKPIIEGLTEEGYETTRELVAALNEKKIPTYTGKGQWHLNTVHRLLKRIDKL